MSYLKKIGALFVSSALLAAALTGCGSSSGSTGDSGSQAEGGDGNYNISIVFKTTSNEYTQYMIAGAKKAAEETANENKDLFEEIKKALNGKVKEVKVNPTLQEHPVTLSSEGGISMEMEKVLRKMPGSGDVESTKVLELNPNHTVFAALKAAHEAGDTAKVDQYAELLYDQSLLIAGLPIEDPVAYAQLVCGLMK